MKICAWLAGVAVVTVGCSAPDRQQTTPQQASPPPLSRTDQATTDADRIIADAKAREAALQAIPTVPRVQEERSLQKRFTVCDGWSRTMDLQVDHLPGYPPRRFASAAINCLKYDDGAHWARTALAACMHLADTLFNNAPNAEQVSGAAAVTKQAALQQCQIEDQLNRERLGR